MLNLEQVQFLCLLLFIGLISSLLYRRITKKCIVSQATALQHQPPSPPALPIIGHLHLLISQVLPKSFQRLALKYGPLMRIRIGASTSLVVSDATVAEEILKTHDLNFASRPEFGSSDYSIYQGSRFLTAEYGSYWRFMRKVCTVELLAVSQLDRLADIRRQERMKLLGVLLKSSTSGATCDVGMELMSMSNNVICRMALSTRCSDNADEAKEVLELVKEILNLGAKLSLGEVLGPLKRFDLFGFGRRLRALLMKFDGLVEGIMMDHENEKFATTKDSRRRRRRRDMLDILLNIYKDENAELKLTRNDIKSFFLDIFLAGTETMSVGMQWALAELINHPGVFEKLREEINTIVGTSRLVQEADVPNLPYLQAVVKESLRLHPPAPLLIRQCRADCKISGYNVSANSRVLINLYAVMRDPKLWKDSAHFIPERFLNAKGVQMDSKARNFDYIPFGSGRRGCPGAALVSLVMHATVGAFVQCFDWKTESGKKIDMEEGMGFSAGMACPLVCYPIVCIDPLEVGLQSG